MPNGEKIIWNKKQRIIRKYENAARLISEACRGLDSEKAFIPGLLHDIGRRTGVSAVRHIIDGYDHALSKGWDEVARVCLTHSFTIKDIEADIVEKDITGHYLNNTQGVEKCVYN